MNSQIWKPIDGFDAYMVSSDGLVLSHKHGKERILRTIVHPRGYRMVSLWKNGKEYPHLVHRLVASAFVPNPSGKDQVNHKNGRKEDSRADNLEWCTASENAQHSYKKLGRQALKGIKNPNAKLDSVIVEKIRNRIGSVRMMAREFGINVSTVHRILKRQVWAHVQ